MNVLVTGGAGFIGSHVADNFNDYYEPEQKKSNIKKQQHNKNYALYREDILNLKQMDDIFGKAKPEAIIHLAARVGVRPSLKEPLLYNDVNVKGTLHILELARKHGVKKLVFASSSSVYGANKKVPFSEDDRTDRPISPYGATKKAGELLCHSYHSLYSMDIACLRFFTVYGERGRPDMAPYKFTKLISEGKEIEVYGDGRTKRDYTYVADIVQGV
ncbi:NAD-dependent epimerase/dehydratase family protein, partial [Candidatus Woesearchaeota archaeon]|nr:NAD-dependent epimerase/dehydratase family protein [Candidatus Woesearchaeota archaeon]